MLKSSLAMIVIGSLVTSSSFATPTQIKKTFMKDQMMKSSLVSHNQTQDSQFKFSGTWTGTCNYGDKSEEMKIRIIEDSTEVSMIDLMDEGNSETASFNVVESKSTSDKEWYTSFTTRLTKVNETTLKFDGTGVFGEQLPSSNKEKGLISVVYTSMYTVNNNQLIIDTNGIISEENKNENHASKCILKKAV